MESERGRTGELDSNFRRMSGVQRWSSSTGFTTSYGMSPMLSIPRNRGGAGEHGHRRERLGLGVNVGTTGRGCGGCGSEEASLSETSETRVPTGISNS